MPLEATTTVPCDGAVESTAVRPEPESLIKTDVPLSTVSAEVVPILPTTSGVTMRCTTPTVV